MLDFLKSPVSDAQDFFLLAGRTFRNLFRRPHYPADIFIQMDIIGVGSLPIVSMIGFFTGAVLGMQMSKALMQYGAVGQTGQLVAITMVRELGPVLTAVVVAGRNAAGIASELGSMKVTEQIDAMRALGTDPIQKLVKPRLIATCTVLPLLTVIADFVGLFGGFLIAYFVLHLTGAQYWNNAWQSLEYLDVTFGLAKPFAFAFIVALVGCHYGLSTTGGTQGVGRSTTQAVVASMILIFVVNFFITRIYVSM